ncbi:hypothetical protein [Nocardia fluminea]|uniref:hypothetical protein n=1 Tax=Nocardia fluminea TaxID=134984 RepID=UPI0033D62F3A
MIQLSPAFVAWKGYEHEVAAPLRQLPGADAYQARFARWLADCGAVTTDVDGFSGLPNCALALIPRAMQPHADRSSTASASEPSVAERRAQPASSKPCWAESEA